MQITTYAAAPRRGRTVALAALAALALGGWQAEAAHATSGAATEGTSAGGGAASATVVIRKVTDPAAGSPAFAFASGGADGQALPGAATFALAGGESLTRQVDAGTTYAVVEDQAGEAAHGYTLAAVGGDGCAVAGASVVVTPQAGRTVTCTFVSERDRPGLSVEAVAPAAASPGDELDVAYTTENTGNVPLHGVAVEDDTCAPVVGPADGAGEDGAVLLPGERWTFSCSSPAGDGDAVVGTVTATAKDPQGATVTATTRHTTTLGAPTPGTGDGAGPTPGDDGGATTPSPGGSPGAHHGRGPGAHAHLHGPSGCAVRGARAIVRGHRIGRVAFRLDGRRLATVRRADRRDRWSVRLVPARLRPGAHRLTATVTFTAATRTRTLKLSFSHCRSVSVRAGATG